MTSTELASELGLIYQRISQPLDREVVGLMDEMLERCEWLARSSELLAEAQFILDKARGEAAEKLSQTKFGASILREFIGNLVAEETRLRNLADRLNVTITHQLDAIRTKISFEKSLSQQTMPRQ